MENWRPSVTALGVAARRAAHQIFDRPLILDDPVALPILPPERGLSADQLVFFSWLGVTPYLTREAFAGTVAFIAAQASPSGVTFDYAFRRDMLPARERAALDFISSRVAEAGEPFQLFFHFLKNT